MVRQVWVTDDGLQFSDKDKAEAHEATLLRKELVDYLFYGVDGVENRRISGLVVDKLLENYTITKRV